jgi:hypothetical protein
LLQVGCEKKVFNFIEVIVWCVENFESKYKLIIVKREGELHVPLTPIPFRNMFIVWFVDHFETKYKLIIVKWEGEIHVPLTPIAFIIMFN